MSPDVSVLITTYNEEEYIGQAIESLLQQTLSAFEIVIVDDGSTDATVETVRESDDDRIRLVPRERMGRSTALNCALRHAEAEYVAIVDPDDPSKPHRLETQYEFLEAHPEVALVGSAYECTNRVRNERYVRRYPSSHEEIVAALSKYVPIAHSSAMARTDALQDVGGYDEELDAIVDLDLYIRLAREYELANVQEPLIEREIRSDSSFHSLYGPLERRWRLLSLNWRAVGELSLPARYYAYPPLHFAYTLLPAGVKRAVRSRLSAVRETEVG